MGAPQGGSGVPQECPKLGRTTTSRPWPAVSKLQFMGRIYSSDCCFPLLGDLSLLFHYGAKIQPRLQSPSPSGQPLPDSVVPAGCVPSILDTARHLGSVGAAVTFIRGRMVSTDRTADAFAHCSSLRFGGCCHRPPGGLPSDPLTIGCTVYLLGAAT